MISYASSSKFVAPEYLSRVRWQACFASELALGNLLLELKRHVLWTVHLNYEFLDT